MYLKHINVNVFLWTREEEEGREGKGRAIVKI